MSQTVSTWIRRWEPKITHLGLKFFPQKRRPHTFENIRSILVVKSCCLGDAILSLYALRDYRKVNPDCRIEVLVSSRIEEVYRSVSFVDAVHVLPITGINLGRELLSFSFFMKFLQLLQLLRKRQFQGLIDLELYRTFGPLLARILGIRYSRGFAVPGSPSKAHDERVFRGKTEPEWKCFYALLGLTPPESNPTPLYLNSNPFTSNEAPQIGLVYGSSFNWPQKRWPVEHFIELGREMQRLGFRLRLFGTSHESELGKQLEIALPGSHNSTGQYTFSQLIKSLQSCTLVVGNDTGTLHAASAAGVRVITLFGPTSPLKWNPLTSRPVFMKDLECRPCYYLSSMPECSHLSCMTKLEPHKVLAIVLEELADRGVRPLLTSNRTEILGRT